MIGTEGDDDNDDERSLSPPPTTPRNDSENEQSILKYQKYSVLSLETGENKSSSPSQR